MFHFISSQDEWVAGGLSPNGIAPIVIAITAVALIALFLIKLSYLFIAQMKGRQVV